MGSDTVSGCYGEIAECPAGKFGEGFADVLVLGRRRQLRVWSVTMVRALGAITARRCTCHSVARMDRRTGASRGHRGSYWVGQMRVHDARGRGGARHRGRAMGRCSIRAPQSRQWLTSRPVSERRYSCQGSSADDGGALGNGETSPALTGSSARFAWTYVVADAALEYRP